MSEYENQKTDATESEELRLLRKIDKKMDALDDGIETMKKTAAIHGAVGGAISGGIVATAISFAKIKLGL